MEIQFKKERFSSQIKGFISVFTEAKIDVDEFIVDELTYRLTSFVYSNTIDERTLTYYCPKPTFLDWLFGRTKKVEFEFKAKDLLLNPPQIKETIRIYEIDPKIKEQ